MLKVIIAAGGTGGHIYPGLSLAEAIRKQNPDSKIIFWGNANSMESKIIPTKGYRFSKTRLGRLNSNVSLLERCMTLLQLPFSILKAVFVLLWVRPKFVIGMGGHVTAPLLIAAKICGVRSYLWEANIYPGMANRKLSALVDEAFLSFQESKVFFKKSFHSGFLVRPGFENIERKNFSNLIEQRKTLLILGGSQGSQMLNHLVSEMILNHKSLMEKFKIIHQAGVVHYDDMQNRYRQCDVEVLPYIEDMVAVMKQASLVVCRAGASTVAEAAAAHLPLVLIPLPSSADDHQTKNAHSLSEAGAAIHLDQTKISPHLLAETLLDLIQDSTKLQQMSEKIHDFHTPFAASLVAHKILNETQ